MGRTGKKSEGSERGTVSSQESMINRLKKWQWNEGDVGRQKIVDIDGENVVVDLAPRYIGNGDYSKKWYMNIFPESYITNPSDESAFDLLSAESIPITTRYRKNTIGDMMPVASVLDKSADNLLKRISKCPTCGKYALPSHSH
jgi:hypothetical protein